MNESYDYYKNLVNSHLLDFIPNIDPKSSTLYDAMKYSLTAGGKRLRSVLLMAACEFAGGSAKEALPYAVAMEFIQSYSLIHDDLPAMDNDDYRRGKLTNHKVYGEATAILAGDGLLNSAFEIMGKDMLMHIDDYEKLRPRIRAMQVMAKGAGVGGMIAGQMSDIENEHAECSTEMLDYIHVNKTGALIVAAMKSGLYLGHADDVMMSRMLTYAENLGLAYQIADDILDVTSSLEEMGKQPKADAQKDKVTYVSLNGLEKSYDRLNELTTNATRAIEEYYDNAEFFRNLVLRLEKRRN